MARVRSSPGAAGSVVSKLSALGVQSIIAVGAIGLDAYGHELEEAPPSRGGRYRQFGRDQPGLRLPILSRRWSLSVTKKNLTAWTLRTGGLRLRN